MRLRTTSGQATPSVVLGLMGETADFLSNYLLLLPSQYVVMTYFSSTLAYINGIQVSCVDERGSNMNLARWASPRIKDASQLQGKLKGMALKLFWSEIGYKFVMMLNGDYLPTRIEIILDLKDRDLNRL